MSVISDGMTQRERELGAIIHSYNEVTERLKESHERLTGEVCRLREELSRKNAQLRRRERLAALGEMAAGVAHEIRNPLAGIQLFASLLEKDLEDRAKERRLAQRIGQCVSMLENIVSDILEFGRPSEPSPGPVQLGRIASEVLELAANKQRQHGATIDVLPGLDGIELTTDGALLHRALLNLVINAIEAASTNHAQARTPLVTIDAAYSPDDTVIVTVSDNGPGVPAGEMDRIFNPFFTTKDDGVGLGLAIVHQIAEALGGSIRATNQSDGGAVFTLQLPRQWSGDEAQISHEGEPGRDSRENVCEPNTEN